MTQRLWTKDYILLLISNFLAAITYTAFVATLAIYVVEKGGDNALAGTMAACMTVVMMLIRPFLGMMMDRFGRRPLIIIGTILFTVNTAAYMLMPSIPMLFVMRLIYGFSTCMFTASTSTRIADIVPDARLVDGIGYLSVSSSLSQMLGPALGTFIVAKAGFSTLFSLMTAACVLSLICVLMLSKNDTKAPRLPKEEKTSAEPKKRLRLIETAVILPAIVSGLMYLSLSSVSNFLSISGTDRGIENVSVFFVVNGGVTMLVRLFAGRLSKKVSDTPLVLTGILLSACGYAIIAFAGSLPPIIIAGVFTGVGTGLTVPILHALVFRLAPAERKGAANATYGIFNDMGNGAGAFAWGLVSTAAGYLVTYLMAAVTAVAGAVCHVTLLAPKMKKRAKVQK